MPLLCAAALVQSMRRETVWHVTREGDSSLPDHSDSSSSVHLGPAPLRFVTFSIDETNENFHNSRRRMMDVTPSTF